MKNIQIIDGAINSTFDIFEIDDDQFYILFPDGANIAFLDDFPNLIDDKNFWSSIYSRKVEKQTVNGIHGTLHLTGSDIDKNEFPSRRENDVRQN